MDRWIGRVSGFLSTFRWEFALQAVGFFLIGVWAMWRHEFHSKEWLERWSPSQSMPELAGWISTVPFGLLVTTAIALTVLSPSYPILGCLAFFLIHRASDRYSWNGVWLQESGLVCGMAILNCSGWLLWRNHRKVPLRQLFRRPIFWIATTWMVWIGITEVVARFERPEETPFLLRNWALAVGAVACLVIGLDTAKSIRDVAVVGFGSVMVIAYRSLLVQEDLWLDGEMALMAVTTMPLLATALALDSWLLLLPIGILCCGFLAWTLVRTHNRGGYLGLLAAVGATPIAFPWRIGLPISIGGIAVAVGILYAYPGYLQRFTEIQSGGRSAASVQSRLEIYRTVIKKLPEYRWFGYGIGRTGYLITAELPEFGHLNAHNTWLANLIETGIPGSSLFNLLLLAGFLHSIRLVWGETYQAKVAGGAILCFLAAYCGIGLGHARDLYEIFYLVVGLAAALPGVKPKEVVPSDRLDPMNGEATGIPRASLDHDQMSRSSIR
jgi:hypothetical protein